MRGFIIITEQALDLAALADRYRDIGEIFLNSPQELIVQNDEKDLWFRIDARCDEDGDINLFDRRDQARVRALIGRPLCASVECSGSDSVNMAVSQLPSEDVFICNDYGIVFTVKEIHRRLKTGEDWEMVGKEFL
jgi:hypothetical protein